VLVSSAFGTLGIVWQESEAGPRVRRILLPSTQVPAQDLVQATFPGAGPHSCPAVDDLRERMQRFLGGEPVGFELGLLALEQHAEFQRRVLLAEFQVPRGWVTTYGRLARHVGVPGGARAAGGALAHNPFPIVIPCHRAVRSDGHLGGFQGGLEMKRALLELEGLEISPTGAVLTDLFYY
jgi:methylated-DNA-[protein]-cysteine S-methyltransferase